MGGLSQGNKKSREAVQEFINDALENEIEDFLERALAEGERKICRNGYCLRNVQTAIAKFKESGFVVRVGSNKDGHWEILKKTISVAAGTMRPYGIFQSFAPASYETLIVCLRTDREQML